MKYDITIGHDCEFFLLDSQGSVVFPSFLKGTKHEPELLENGAWQRDNLMLEINGIPQNSPSGFLDNFQRLYGEVMDKVQTEGCVISTNVGVSIPRHLRTLKELQEIGCDPDYNAWTGEKNKALDHKDLGLARFAAGHLHFSWPKSDVAPPSVKMAFIRSLDITLGVVMTSTLYDNVMSMTRKKHYGRTGSMRFKPYGVEWRVPDNTWAHNLLSGQIQDVYDIANVLAKYPFYADELREQNPSLVEDLRDIVDSCNIRKAKSMLGFIDDEIRGIKNASNR